MAHVLGGVTNALMQKRTGEHPKDITGVLQTLVRDGPLTQQNQRRWTSYRVAEDARKNKKLPVPQLQTIIQRFCAGRWLSTFELAACALTWANSPLLNARMLEVTMLGFNIASVLIAIFQV